MDWIVHIKNVDTGEHIIEPVVATNINVSLESENVFVSTIRGEEYQISGPRRGQIDMQFDASMVENVSPIFALPVSSVDIQINPVDSDVNYDGYTRCVLSSMNHEINELDQWINVTWVFMGTGNPAPWNTTTRVPRQEIEADKYDWRQEGF